MNADAEVMRFVGSNAPQSRPESDRSLATVESHWAELGFGLWAAERLDSGEPIGFIGLATPSFLPEVLPAVEVGWRLARRHWGHGLATEGALAAVARGFDSLGLERIVSITVPANVRSQRVMGKLGLRWDRAAIHPRLGMILQVRVITLDAWEQAEAAR